MLDKETKGIIAYKILRYKVRTEHLKIGPDMSRNLGNIAKETGIPIEELKQFARELIHDVLKEALD